MDTINGYQIRKPFSSENAGFCRWAIGEKYGRAYFIKEFLSPKYPADDCGLSEKTIAKKRAECEKFYDRKAKLYQAVQQCRTGNVVVIQDFFREGSKYYAVTEQVKAENLSPSQIAALPESKKMTLIRAILYSFSVLHSKAIVHSDVKPDNILVKRTENGFYTGKIIDFDASFLEADVPEEIAGDQVYLAPETRLRMMEEPVSVTTKADVFALGILIHQYWCGKLPGCPKEYDYLFEAVLDGAQITLSEKLPQTLADQIRQMIQADPEKRPDAQKVLQALAEEAPKVPPTPEKPGQQTSRVKINMSK